MLCLADPKEAYRRSQFDARVQGSDPAELVHVCLEQVIAGIGGAIMAHERGDPAGRSKGLTRSLTAITALEMGVDRAAPLAGALLQLYGAGRKAVLDSVTGFQAHRLAEVRRDFLDIDRAMREAVSGAATP